MKFNYVYFHADDYGITLQQSKDILDCFENGKLNSVSIIPNSEHLAESKELLENYKIRKVVHLNFIEGRSVADYVDDTFLTDAEGKLKCSFGYLLKCNFSFPKKKKKIKEQLKREILAQIHAVMGNQKEIIVDSHQHLLMIPLVFNAFMEIVKEKNYHLTEMRLPVDPIKPLLSTPSLWKRVRPIDCIKWLVLKLCCIGRKKQLLKMNCQVPVFFGILFTCRMEKDIVSKLLPKYIKCAEKENAKLELMFHPGGIYKEDELLDASQKDLVDFYKSPYRKKEAYTIMNMGDEIIA